ncbi:MAG: tetratricopeptide repeat protein [Candidatus Aminicenantales bacterium]
MIGPNKIATPLLALALAVSLSAAAGATPASSGNRSAEPQRKAKASDEKDPQYQYEKGVIALRYGLTDEAVRYGKLAVSLDPGNFNGWNLLGSAYYTKGEFALAAEAYEKAVVIRPEAAEVQRDLGLTYAELKDVGKAEAALKRAYGINGGYESAYHLSKLYYNAGRFEEALDYVLKSIQKNGKNAGAYNLKGVVLNELKRYAEAAGSFQAGLVLAPDDIGLQINLGIALLNSGEPSKARAVFEAVLPKIEQDVLRKRVEDYIKALRDAGK